MLLASRDGKAIRFAAEDVREFQSRTSTGVRGMTLKDGDEVVSLSILKTVEADAETRDAYLRVAPWKDENAVRTQEQQAMADAEEFVLTVCANGYGKISSAYEYRRTGRGGQGIVNIDNIARNGPVVNSFAANVGDQLMLVTDKAKLIRINLASLRVLGRNTAGVRLFDVDKNEHVVSVARIDEEEAPETEAEEAIVEEMIGRDAQETQPRPTMDRDDNAPTEE